MSEPTVQVSLPGRPVWADLLIMALSLLAMGGMILLLMPQAERQLLAAQLKEIRLTMYRGLSERARLAGRAGMSDELDGRNPRVRYEQARALAWWRDRVKP